MKIPLNFTVILASLAVIAASSSCSNNKANNDTKDTLTHDTSANIVKNDSLPPISESKTKFSDIIDWPADKTPTAPAGFTVNRFAEGIKSPRYTYITPNGDVLVVLANSERTAKEKITNKLIGKDNAEVGGKSANTILLYRDANKDGVAELSSVFLNGLNQPFGMLVVGNNFYVANTDGITRYPYKSGQTKIEAAGKKILNLPAGGYNNHWTRNLIANADGSKIYVSVGSGSNVGEHGMSNEKRRANILQINPDGSGEIIYASGLRNPVGMDWNPITHDLWAAVNERDELGDDLVPDYITSVKKGAFYGWPFSYFGQHEDPRRKGENPAMVAKAMVPDYALEPHSASLGLAFYDGDSFPQKYKNGAFVGQHGSWNRSKFTGYKVIFVPFKNGKPNGEEQDFLSGFIADGAKGTVYGRPVGVTVAPDGALLVADDGAGIVWRVAPSK